MEIIAFCGHLIGSKVTPKVAKMREAVAGSSLFSPFPFHSVYSIEDHKKHVDWIKEINPQALVSVKVSTPTDVDMVAVGSYLLSCGRPHHPLRWKLRRHWCRP